MQNVYNKSYWKELRIWANTDNIIFNQNILTNFMEIILIITGFIIGSIVTSKLFMKKKMDELEYYRNNELRMFDSNSQEHEEEVNDEVNTKNFISIFLHVDLPELNAIYENNSVIVKFHIDKDSISEFMHVSTTLQERYAKNIQTRFANGEMVKIPKDIIAEDKLRFLLRTGTVEVYSKDNNKQTYEILYGHNNINLGTAIAMNEYYCLPNGKIILAQNTGFMLSLIHI